MKDDLLRLVKEEIEKAKGLIERIDRTLWDLKMMYMIGPIEQRDLALMIVHFSASGKQLSVYLNKISRWIEGETSAQ